MVRSANLTGALLMVASMAAFTINDIFMKLMAGDVPLFQLLFMRGALTTVAVGVIAWRMGVLFTSIPRRDIGILMLRTVGEIGATYFFLTALFNMPIANITAILQALPLTITLAAALFFKEAVGWRRMLAIVVGFCGVMLIVRPDSDGFNTYALCGLAAVAFVTLRDLSTRRLSDGTPSMFVTFVTSVAVMVCFGLANLTGDWVQVGPRELGLTVGAAVSIIGGYLCSVMVMRVGEISFIAPFRYTGLIWALVLGWLVLGEWPDGITMIGAGIVVASGLFTLYRETRLGQKKFAVRAPHPR